MCIFFFYYQLALANAIKVNLNSSGSLSIKTDLTIRHALDNKFPYSILPIQKNKKFIISHYNYKNHDLLENLFFHPTKI